MFIVPKGMRNNPIAGSRSKSAISFCLNGNPRHTPGMSSRRKRDRQTSSWVTLYTQTANSRVLAVPLADKAW